MTANSHSDQPNPQRASDSVRNSTESFPRLFARTLRFTLGEPRNIAVVADGSRVLFVRTASGIDRTGALWVFDVATATERLLADPAALLGTNLDDIPPEERARRERTRESGAGIVSYSIDKTGTTAVFALAGQIWCCAIATGETRRLPTPGGVIDPRIDPTGRHIAYACGGSLRVVGVDGTGDRALVTPHDAIRHDGTSDDDSSGDGSRGDDSPGHATVTWGQAEFVAAEEMGRYRGFWWAPDGQSLLVERYDTAPVATWYLTDPSRPEVVPTPHRYPAAGTANADVALFHVYLDGSRRHIPWDTSTFPYLTTVSWSSGGPLMQVVSRDQRRAEIRRIVLDEDETRSVVMAEPSDPQWLDLVPGLPALTADGRLLTSVADTDPAAPAYRLALDSVAISPPGWQLRRVLDVTDTGVLATVSDDPTQQHLAFVGFDGDIRVLSDSPGVHSGVMGGGTVVVASARVDAVGSTMTIFSDDQPVGTLRTLAATPPFTPDVTMLSVGARGLRAAVLFPRHHVPGAQRLPVIMAPYGGPHAQLVRASGRMFLQSQWLADQGFAVVVADGRGSPGRGPVWERTIDGELASVTLQDQVDAIAGVAERFPNDVHAGRVGIMGWSYGGYLAALAVMDRPDVFRAAVAGAPVTDWSLYDTYYTERYLGDPVTNADVYRRNSLIDRAPGLARPLLLIHGLADDNVVVAHTLRLSAALLAAGREHHVLPLTGITHMASDEVVAENLLVAQVEFFRRHL